ncbi:hypothetical protein I7I50_04593 [Histoplasma capsulatum G186AR]|uniref:Uncharacterized protein n=1 Tax=Ajellomyces capsulatus TaxID=5037 RepID=A0A8H8CY34_AJECA|nr:hypothetical protein I7I52_05502 [Histoplasma capsulatum]QSS75456.1 hypothetical protein I7I50_04593 [Histoplasma capsulatum G186AR]
MVSDCRSHASAAAKQHPTEVHLEKATFISMVAISCSYKLRSLPIVPSYNYQVSYPSFSLELIATLCRHQTQSVSRSHGPSTVALCKCVTDGKAHYSVCCIAISMTVTAKVSIFLSMKTTGTLRLILTSLMLQATTFHHQIKI